MWDHSPLFDKFRNLIALFFKEQLYQSTKNSRRKHAKSLFLIFCSCLGGRKCHLKLRSPTSLFSTIYLMVITHLFIYSSCTKFNSRPPISLYFLLYNFLLFIFLVNGQLPSMQSNWTKHVRNRVFIIGVFFCTSIICFLLFLQLNRVYQIWNLL